MEKNQFMEKVKDYKNFFLVEGILFILFGIFAMARPLIFSLTLDYFLGWLFILSGLAVGIRSLQTSGMPNQTATILSAIFYFIFGILLLTYPVAGILTLTLLLGFYFLLDGAAKIYSGVQIKSLGSLGLLVTSGIISLILGVLIIACSPLQAPWMLGILVGMNLLITGISDLMFTRIIKSNSDD